MKKMYLLTMLLIASVVTQAQITPTTYRGAFAPAPTAMWTDSWTNFDPQNTVYPAPTVTVNTAITTNTTWTSGNTYLLSGLVYVKNNATLTIQPGTKILGDNTGSALIITKGAKINAVGTAASPIVFTSDKPVGQRNKGDWGGVILLGKGAFNLNGGVNNIEGITASADTQYGGGASPVANDNSGTMKYVRIEFGGYVFAPNSEINGLTFGAVGSGTTIDFIQCSYINDDGFEWFGGNVTCKHLVSFRNLDDDFDTDNGFSGIVQFALCVRDPNIADAPAVSTSEGFESDNNSAGSEVSPYTSAIFTNFTMVGPTYRATLPSGGTMAAGYKRVARIRRASHLRVYNSVFMDYLEGLHIDGIACENAAVAGTLKWSNNIMAGITTTAKVLQVNAPGTITAGNNPSFNMTAWYAANGNTTLSSNSGLLTMAYNASNGSLYTGLDYRPATSSPALSGADFSDMAGTLDPAAPAVVSPIYRCNYSVPVPLTATLTYGATQLKWYTNPTGGSPLAGAPSPSTSTIGTRSWYVSQVYPSGAEGPRAQITVNIVAVPAIPAAISGPLSVCSYVGTETGVTYSTTAVAGAASYEWIVPAGVNLVSTSPDGLSIVVNYMNTAAGSGTVGQIKVKAVSEHGCASAEKFVIISKSLPVAPGTISGPTAVGNFVATNVTKNYTIASVPSATSYLWEVPAGVNIVSGQGTNTVSVNFLNVGPGAGAVGNMSVKSVSGCGMSVARTLALSKGLPGKPAVIFASSNNPCAYVGTSTNITYSITPLTDITTYQWTVPTGASIVGSATGSSIEVSYGTGFVASGSVSIRGVNGVGVGDPRTLSVTRAVPLAPTSISGPVNSLCADTPYSYSYPAYPTATSYTITGPAGSVVRSASFPLNATNVLSTNELAFTVSYPVDFVTGTISITSSNGCASSVTPRTLTVNKTTATALPITGPTTITCAMIGQEITYTTPAVALPTTYQWTVPTGAAIISGQGTNSITVMFSSAISTGAKIRCKAVTDCGGPAATDRVVTLTKESCERPAAENVVYSPLYPNPAKDVFSVDIEAAAPTTILIKVFAFNGQPVIEQKREVNAGRTTLNTNVSLLTKGIYIVKIIDSVSGDEDTQKLYKE